MKVGYDANRGTQYTKANFFTELGIGFFPVLVELRTIALSS
jgi:hypothetical protein